MRNDEQVYHAHDVFISYTHLDAEHDVANARAIGNWLDDEGYDVWWDRHLLFGNVQKHLERKVRHAKCVIVLWSPRAAKSEWVARECEWAVNGDKLAPVIIEDHPLPREWERFLWLKLTDFQAQKEELRRRLPPPALKRGVAIAGLPTPARTFIGREKEVARLRRAWGSTAAGADPALKTNVFVLHAIGGAGKSALLQEFLRPLDDGKLPGGHSVYAWSAYSQGSGENRTANADEFIAKALGYFGHDLRREPIKDPVERGRRLAHLVGERRTLMILDGLEPLQHAPHINEGRLRDRGLAEFVKKLARENRGLLLITSRQELPELTIGQAPRVISNALDRMGVAEGVALLTALGVHGKRSEMEHAVDEALGHALLLNLLGTYLSAVHGGDVNHREQFRLGEIKDAEADFVGDVTARYAKRAARIIEGTIACLSEPEIAILHMVGLFDRPVEREALDALLADPPVLGLTEAFHTLNAVRREARWNVAVERLRKLKLLNAEDRHEPGRLDAHPIVRAHFGNRLKAGTPEAYREAHSRLYDFYRYQDLPQVFCTPEAYGLLAYEVWHPGGPLVQRASQAAAGDLTLQNTPHLPPSFYRADSTRMLEATMLIGTPAFNEALQKFLPGDIDGMRPCFSAIIHGSAAGRHQDAYCEVYWPRVACGNEGRIVHKFGALNANLGALASFFDQVWSVPAQTLSDNAKARVLNFAAFALRAQGRLREAVEPFEASLSALIATRDWQNAARGASNVSELRLALGDIEKAIAAAQTCITYADASGDVSMSVINRTTLADALLQAGRAGEAQELFKESEALQAMWQPTLPKLYSVQGYRYCDLLLAQGMEVIERATYAATVARNYGLGLLSSALNNLSLGRAYVTLASATSRPSGEHARRAERYLENAVDSLRRAGTNHCLPGGLLARAAFRRNQGDYSSAATDLDEAYDIASRGEMRLHLTDYHLESARLALAQSAATFDLSRRTHAETHTLAAANLIACTGYKRRLQELAAIRACLNGGIPATILAPDRDMEGHPIWRDLIAGWYPI